MDERQRFVQYFRAKKVTLEMARDRGFSIAGSEHILNMEFDQFMAYYRKEAGKTEFDHSFFDREFRKDTLELMVLTNKTTGKSREEERLKTNLLLFKFAPKTSGKTFNFGAAQEFLAEMKDTKGDIRTGVLIVEQRLSTKSKKSLEEKMPFYVQVFQVEKLQFNPTKHMFAPIYKIMTKKEQRDFLKENGIKLKELPLMSIEDPIAKYFGLENGSIVEKTVRHFVGETLTDPTIEYSVVNNTPL